MRIVTLPSQMEVWVTEELIEFMKAAETGVADVKVLRSIIKQIFGCEFETLRQLITELG